MSEDPVASVADGAGDEDAGTSADCTNTGNRLTAQTAARRSRLEARLQAMSILLIQVVQSWSEAAHGVWRVTAPIYRRWSPSHSMVIAAPRTLSTDSSRLLPETRSLIWADSFQLWPPRGFRLSTSQNLVPIAANNSDSSYLLQLAHLLDNAELCVLHIEDPHWSAGCHLLLDQRLRRRCHVQRVGI